MVSIICRVENKELINIHNGENTMTNEEKLQEYYIHFVANLVSKQVISFDTGKEMIAEFTKTPITNRLLDDLLHANILLVNINQSSVKLLNIEE